jgi:hypothetical protein
MTAPVTHERSGNGNGSDHRDLAAGVARLRTNRGPWWSERRLLVAAAVVAPLGLVFVFLGWWGAAHTPNLFEQVPYLISGGLFGLGLVFVGGFCYFAHWLTESVREQRAQSATLAAAISRLEAAVRQSTTATGATTLVATIHGTMAHRPDCVVVDGQPELRTVRPADRLLPCKLCDPYGP